VDVNCGCPKHFSIQGGMGAALLTDPTRLCAILTKLVQESGLPVTCKIRVLPDPADTLQLCQMIESCGVSALAVHCRTREQRPRDPADPTLLLPILQTLRIPVILNGDAFTPTQIQVYRDTIRPSGGIMLARGAMWNPSVFRCDRSNHAPLLPCNLVAKEYVRLAARFRNRWENTKYVALRLYENDVKDPVYAALLKCKSLSDLCRVLGVADVDVASLPDFTVAEWQQSETPRRQAVQTQA